MRTNFIGQTLALGAAVGFLAGCGDISDFAPDPSPAVRPVAAVPTVDIPTPEPTPTIDSELAQLQAIILHDTTVLNADFDALYACEGVISDVGACHSALTVLRAHLAPMLVELQAMRVGEDLQKRHDEMVGAITALQAGCDDDLQYLVTRHMADNEKATHELNQGFALLDAVAVGS
jgi:hypothetical protein